MSDLADEDGVVSGGKELWRLDAIKQTIPGRVLRIYDCLNSRKFISDLS
jgi:hypothetical protein